MRRLPQGPRAPPGPRPRRGPGRGREAPLRIKKIAERRTIWGGGRLRRKRGAEDHGDGREQPQERGARRLDRLHLPGGAGAQQRRPGLGHGRHPDRRARRVWPARPGISPRRPARDQARPRRRLTPPAQAFAGHAEDHWINVVTSRAGGAFAEVRRPPAPREPARRAASWPLRESARARARARRIVRRATRARARARASKATSWACGPGAAMIDCGRDFVIRAGPRDLLPSDPFAPAALFTFFNTGETPRSLPRRGHESG